MLHNVLANTLFHRMGYHMQFNDDNMNNPKNSKSFIIKSTTYQKSRNLPRRSVNKSSGKPEYMVHKQKRIVAIIHTPLYFRTTKIAARKKHSEI